MNNFLKCPFTDETIMKITPRGIFRTPLYSEVFLELTDGSRMRIALSKNAKKNLKVKQVDDFFEKLRKDRIKRVKSKVLTKETREKHLSRINKVEYKSVFDRGALLLKK